MSWPWRAHALAATRFGQSLSPLHSGWQASARGRSPYALRSRMCRRWQIGGRAAINHITSAACVSDLAREAPCSDSDLPVQSLSSLSWRFMTQGREGGGGRDFSWAGYQGLKGAPVAARLRLRAGRGSVVPPPGPTGRSGSWPCQWDRRCHIVTGRSLARPSQVSLCEVRDAAEVYLLVGP